ncbi:MAG TPA: response regulator [Candidatus Eisenbacteria bacterium]|jgi:CheY-like chemotaxis protein|nr:response regulator [Candidatus Eisenbacteria bacterium]
MGGPVKKVLVVDDEPLLLELLEKRLSPHYEVLAAFNGEEGLESAMNHRPDLILSDLLMPKMDGFELRRTLRLHEHTREIPFVILSAVADMSSIEKAKELGILDYLIKPMHLEELPGLIKRYV